jgi:hypothetical protein
MDADPLSMEKMKELLVEEYFNGQIVCMPNFLKSIFFSRVRF